MEDKAVVVHYLTINEVFYFGKYATGCNKPSSVDGGMFHADSRHY